MASHFNFIYMIGDNNNLNEKNLKTAYFLETKRKYLKKFLFVFLIVFNLVAYPFLIYHYTAYFAQRKEMDGILEEINQTSSEFNVVNKTNAPLSLNVGMAGIVPLADGKYNLICQVENPNRKWFVELIKFKFTSPSGFESKEYESFVLPEEEKLLVDFNEKINGAIDQISCQTTQIKWQRTKVKNYKLLTIPQDFTFQDVQYVPGLSTTDGATTQFKFINSTVYNLRDINLFVFLYEGNKIVGVERTSVEETMSGQEKDVKIIWLSASSFVSRTVIKPEINIFDPLVFIESPIIPDEKR